MDAFSLAHKKYKVRLGVSMLRGFRLPLIGPVVVGFIIATASDGVIRAQPEPAHGLTLSNNSSVLPVDAPTRVPIFLPPALPVLGAPSPLPAFIDLRYLAPTELAKFVGEPFYTPLGILCAEQKVSAKISTQLEVFRKLRTGLEEELLTKIATLSSRPPDDQERELSAFELTQKSRLAELASLAETLRRSCVNVGVDQVAVHDLVPDDETPRDEEAQKRQAHEELLIAAFFDEGLTPAQRDLLSALAAVKESESTSPERKPLITTNRRILFFPPGAARIVIPISLPEPLATKLAAFETLQSALKQELNDVVSRSRSDADYWREKIWRKLANAQKERLAAYEKEAEDLRKEFRDRAVSFQPAQSPRLPTDFVARLDAYRHGVDEVQAELGRRVNAKLRELLRYEPGSGKIAYRSHALVIVGGLYLHTVSFDPTLNTSEEEKPIWEQLKPTLDAFRSEFSNKNQALEDSRKLLEQDLKKIMAADAKSQPSQALAAFLRIAMQTSEWSRFDEYRQAVLLPGLSPDQRRLLLGLAARQLDRPLPGGTLRFLR